jgi:hypothetical protein
MASGVVILLDVVAALSGEVVPTLGHGATTLGVGASTFGGFVCCQVMIAVSSWMARMCLILSADDLVAVPPNALRKSTTAAMEGSCCKVTGTWQWAGYKCQVSEKWKWHLQECRIGGIGSGQRRVRRRSHRLHVAPRKCVILDRRITGLWFLVGPGVSC